MAATFPENLTTRILDALARTPYMTVEDLGECYRCPITSTRALLKQAEADNLVASVGHALLRRKKSERFCLTGDGVKALAEMLHVPMQLIMVRRGATYLGLSYLRKRLDILACLYRVYAAIAELYESCVVPMTIYTSAPIDAVVHLPGPPSGVDDPYWVGIMVDRPNLGQSMREKLAHYEGRPSRPAHPRPPALLVLTPNRPVNHYVVQTLRTRHSGEAFIAPAPDVMSAYSRVWTQRTAAGDRLSMEDVLDEAENPYATPAPTLERYARAALPRPTPPPNLDLGVSDKKVLCALAYWPLATRDHLPPFADLGQAQTLAAMTRLRKHGLAHTADRSSEPLYALTEAGYRWLTKAARGSEIAVLKKWSSKRNEKREWTGSALRTRAGEPGHIRMIYDVVHAFGAGARARPDIIQEYALLPDHLSRIEFPVDDSRYPRVIVPDATIILERERRRDVLLLEVEQGRPSPSKMEGRLASYGTYYEDRRPAMDHGATPYIAVILRDAAYESQFLLAQRRARLAHLPILTTIPERLDRNFLGPFGAVWRTPRNLGAMLQYENWRRVREE